MEVITAISYFSIFLTLIYVFVVATFIRGWAIIKVFKPNNNQAKTKVSILIAARNEELLIGKTLSDIIAQDYDKSLVEVIVIDDHSTDRTSEIISSYAKDGVKLITLNEANALNSYKKKAIQTAIAEAVGDLIITTDADCRMGTNWLKTIVNCYETNGYKMISSPVAYFEEKSFFEKLQTLEFSYLIGLGASTIGNNNPSTCNGANLAYEKEAFFEVGGFTGIDDLASGDDELLLHKMTAMYDRKIGFLKNADAIVYTHAKPTLSEFLQQRKRWASKTTKYKDKVVLILGASIWLFNLSILINAFLAIIFPASNSLQFLFIQLALKFIIELIFLIGITNFFKRKQLLFLLPILNIPHILYFIYIGILGSSGKYDWKGRLVN
ncbi:glycosyltransferase family 2 protein [Pedobacter cryotolerans]|uniref:Glycosyltransferase n=1 Tax=Pedobacter cryotolerans TaxID=2571270 RepID=A0A4U1C889_9SPHI|nr:glycosyltransferase [Pedobacter cryotolerans]TKC01818.1 glycosyltransferase [Pedobacter cryotolerans]